MSCSEAEVEDEEAVLVSASVASLGWWYRVEGSEVVGGEMLVEDDEEAVRALLAVEDEGIDKAGELSVSGDGMSREVSVEEAEDVWGSTSRRWAVILPRDSTSWKDSL